MEQLISFESAKLAKEKGFNIPVKKYFYDEFHKQSIYEDELRDYSQHKKGALYECIAAPSQSLLQTWLRETTGILLWCSLNPISSSHGWCYNILAYDEGVLIAETRNQSNNDVHLSYEEALEIGLQESLKLIKIE